MIGCDSNWDIPKIPLYPAICSPGLNVRSEKSEHFLFALSLEFLFIDRVKVASKAFNFHFLSGRNGYTIYQLDVMHFKQELNLRNMTTFSGGVNNLNR